MDGSPTPAPPVSPVDMEELKSICSLIQAGRITWDDIVALHELGLVKRHAAFIPAAARSKDEQELALKVHDVLMAKHGQEIQFPSVMDTLITLLFDRPIGRLPNLFKKFVEEAKKAA